jgi:hypothetical protein
MHHLKELRKFLHRHRNPRFFRCLNIHRRRHRLLK